MVMPSKSRLRTAAFGALLIALTSQINISLMTGGFKISVAIILLPTLAFLIPTFPIVLSTFFAAPGVFLLRILVDFLSDGTRPNPWVSYAPELIFYLSYGLLLALYLRRTPLHPYRLVKFLPLVAIDVCANFLELLVRLGAGAFSIRVFGRLVFVGLCRALLAAAVLRMLDYYGFQVLRREDADRYRRLLLLTASLKSEVAWMDKSTALVESTMNAAYQLYSKLRRANTAPETVDAALTIAKDIHEVKKEYFLIMRGISEALDSDAIQGGMQLKELFELMRTAVLHMAAESSKQITFASRLEYDFYTEKQHYLMSILQNLLGNAVEASKPDLPARITLCAQKSGDHIVFTVQDDCGGIPTADLEQIFTAGFSSKINRSTGEVNRGLGLCIVKELVQDKLGGTITVCNADGGAVFTITLPSVGLES